jgi:hypothetical protein
VSEVLLRKVIPDLWAVVQDDFETDGRVLPMPRRLAGWWPPALSSKARPPCETRQALAGGRRRAARFRRIQVHPKDLRVLPVHP